jgi:hypothetical protein
MLRVADTQIEKNRVGLSWFESEFCIRAIATVSVTKGGRKIYLTFVRVGVCVSKWKLIGLLCLGAAQMERR